VDILPGLPSSYDLPDLYLPSSWDYRRESLNLNRKSLFYVDNRTQEIYFIVF
jgi:hypothetical protein